MLFAASKFDNEYRPFVKGVKIQVATLDEIMSLDIEAFFEYVKSLQYGYRDKFGGIHIASDKDFAEKAYSFSSPEEIVKNNCCWCWDLAEFIKLYCTRHGIICRSYFMEYFSNELHQTHTQVFLYSQGKWSAAPDNCLGLVFGTPSFNELEDCVQWFLSLFTGYLMSILKEKYDMKNLFVKEYTCAFSAGISDDEYLSQVRKR